jgi:CheY-like chemotaxis protein
VAERVETILVVEDNEDDVLLIQRAFRKAAIANPLRVLRDGNQAVAYLSGAEPYADRRECPLPALVLLDLKLPRRSGLEVLKWLRQQPGIGRLITVVLTSSRESADVNRAYELGANSYLVKPVLLNDLVDMMTLWT